MAQKDTKIRDEKRFMKQNLILKKSHCGYIVWNKLIFKAKQIFMDKEIHYFLKLPEI